MQNSTFARFERSPDVRRFSSGYLPVIFLFLLLSAAGCRNVASGKVEYAYVAAPEANLRDRVAAVYNKTGSIHNGERVIVLERLQSKRFVKVRSPRNEEGWVQERFLASPQTFNQLEGLAAQYKDAPAQAVAVTRAPVNLHATPGRKTEHLYQLGENERVDLLLRQVVDRNAPAPVTMPQKAAKKDQKQIEREKEKQKEREAISDLPTDDQAEKPASAPVLEDWWLIRSSQKRVGWVLGRILYVDVPIEIAQYAEGQRIVAFFVLDNARDKDHQVPEYLTLLTENKDGQPYDFTQARVFTWNTRRHRYETAFREHRLAGVLPVTVGAENDTRIFILRLKDEQTGAIQERKYTFTSPMVRRVYAEGEEPKAKRKR